MVFDNGFWILESRDWILIMDFDNGFRILESRV